MIRRMLLVLALAVSSVLVAPAVPTSAARTAAVQPTKVLLFGALENMGDLKAMQKMPYLRGVAAANIHMTKVADSLPSCDSGGHYLIYAFGSNHGVCDDAAPKKHPMNYPSIWGDALRNGLTAKTYVQSQQGNCALTNQGTKLVAVRHDYGWPYSVYGDERAQCGRYVVPMEGNLQADIDAGTLPNVGGVAWDLRHDAHVPSTPADADAFMRTELPKVLAGPDFQSGALVVWILTDEASGPGDPNVLSIVLHQGSPAHVDATALDQHAVYVSLDRYAGQLVSGVDALAAVGL